jgi:hypothetical protein
MRRTTLLLVALLHACALAVLVLGCPRRPRVDPTWTPQRLRDQLERAGLVYDAQAVRGWAGSRVAAVRGLGLQ